MAEYQVHVAKEDGVGSDDLPEHEFGVAIVQGNHPAVHIQSPPIGLNQVLVPMADRKYVSILGHNGQLRSKRVASNLEPLFDHLVILDDPVVYDGDAPIPAQVRVHVFLGRRPMCGPACVPDPDLLGLQPESAVSRRVMFSPPKLPARPAPAA